MIVESWNEIPIGSIVEVTDTSQRGPTVRARVLRRATREEFIAEVRREDPEFEAYAHLYAVVHPDEHHYEVSED